MTGFMNLHFPNEARPRLQPPFPLPVLGITSQRQTEFAVFDNEANRIVVLVQLGFPGGGST